jgi:hypothetical protein
MVFSLCFIIVHSLYDKQGFAALVYLSKVIPSHSRHCTDNLLYLWRLSHATPCLWNVLPPVLCSQFILFLQISLLNMTSSESYLSCSLFFDIYFKWIRSSLYFSGYSSLFLHTLFWYSFPNIFRDIFVVIAKDPRIFI